MDPGTIIGIIGILIGIPGLIIGWPAIKSWIKSRRAKYILLLFGPKGAGKSTLVRYLEGKSLPEKHRPTLGHEATGKIVYDLSGNSTFFFTIRSVIEVGGEFGSRLARRLADDNPHAIILLCDTTNEANEKRALNQITNALKDTLEGRPTLKINCKLLMILLNKCDIWGNDAASQHAMMSRYKDQILRPELSELTAVLNELAVRIHAVSLRHADFRLQTDDALREMALILKDGEG